MDPVDPPAVVAPVSPSGAAAPALRVLVADDHRDHADSLADVLQLLGCEVVVAYDGPTALDAVSASQPALCLFDIGMPGLDGYALAAAVRRLPGGAARVLVAVTGLGQPQDLQRAQAAGFDRWVCKPLGMAQLMELLALPPVAAPADAAMTGTPLRSAER